MHFSASPQRLLRASQKTQNCEFWISGSQLAVALTAAQLSSHTSSTSAGSHGEAAKACPVPKGTGSTPRPTCWPTAPRSALGGHPGLSCFGLISVFRQQEHVLAVGVIWDGRACPARFTCSDTQLLHRCDPCQTVYCHAPACSWGAEQG